MTKLNEATNDWVTIEILEVKNALQGERVCVTGHLGISRKKFQELVSAAGAEIHDTVKSNTTILVSNNDWTAINLPTQDGKKKSSKLIAAEKNNRNDWGTKLPVVRTRIMNEAMFIALLAEKAA